MAQRLAMVCKLQRMFRNMEITLVRLEKVKYT